MGGFGLWTLAAWIALATLLGCAPTQPRQPTQVVVLELEPARVSIYVDGERRETIAPPGGGEQRIELRSDVSHVLYFKRDGYRPERVVLTSEQVDGLAQLRPERVAVRLDPLTPIRRELSVELDARAE